MVALAMAEATTGAAFTVTSKASLTLLLSESLAVTVIVALPRAWALTVSVE